MGAAVRSWANMRCSLNIAIFLFSGFFALACQSRPAQNKTSVHLSLTADPTSLDPRRARDLDSVNVLRMLFEGLTRMGKDGKTELGLAEQVEISDDALHYTFHLRKARWSNGDGGSAFDFEKAWKTILDPEFATDIAHQLYPIKNARLAKLGQVERDMIGVKAENEETLVVELEIPCPYFLKLLSMSCFLPVHARTAEEFPNWFLELDHFVSNGPFILNSWEHSNRLSLTKNDQFWEKHSVHLDAIDIFVVSADTALRMYEEGSLDWAGSPLSLIPPDAIAKLKREERLQSSPFLATSFYRMNTTDVLGGQKNSLSNSDVRRALSLALDRQAIVTHILQGKEVCARSLTPPSMELKTDGYFSEDLEEAKRILTAYGPIEPITISYSNNERNAAIAQAIQNTWQSKLGITIILEAVEPKVYFQRISNKQYQIAAGSWSADFDDPINFLELFKYRDCGTNNTNWENEEYIDLLNRSGLCNSKEERIALLREAECILMREMPIIPIYHFSLNYLKTKELEDAILSPMGQLDFRFAYFHSQEQEKMVR